MKRLLLSGAVCSLFVIAPTETAYAIGGGGPVPQPNAPAAQPYASSSSDVALNQVNAVGVAGINTEPATDTTANNSHFVSSNHYRPTGSPLVSPCSNCCPTSSSGIDSLGRPYELLGLWVGNTPTGQYLAQIELPPGWSWDIKSGLQAAAWSRMMAQLQSQLHSAGRNVQDHFYAAMVDVELRSGSILSPGGECTGVLLNGLSGLVQGAPHSLPVPPWQGVAARAMPNLVAAVEASWTTGTVAASPSAIGYVFVPVCAWITGTTLPFQPQHKWVYEGVSSSGFTYVLRFDLYAQALGVRWSFSDGTTTTTSGPGAPGAATYNGASWSGCNGSAAQHIFKQVSSAATVSAAATVAFWASVSWDAGTGMETLPVAVNPSTLAVPLGNHVMPIYQVEGI